jgi:hypothetical protein
MVPHTHTGTSGKYEPLTTFLRHQSRDVVSMSFSEIERVIRAKLPRSAMQHRAWWSNNADNNVMTKAWKDAGFESERVDMNRRRVTFRRVTPHTSRGVASPSVNGTSTDHHPLLGWMKGMLTVSEGVDLTQPADAAWGEAAHGEGSPKNWT